MNLKSLKEGELKPVVEVLEKVFHHLNIDYYLIGAFAQAVWYSAIDKQFRQTKDIDFAVLIGSQQEYGQLRKHLIEIDGFTPAIGNDFGLRNTDGVQIDILPFGAIEAEGNVVISIEGNTEMSMAGFSEVYESGVEVEKFSDENSFKVATLPAIVMLKLIAYDDRPEHRLKDAVDISNILIHFFDLQEDLIYEQHNDLFANERELNEIAAIVIGREMKKIVVSNSKLEKRIKSIIKHEVKLFEKSAFIRQMKVSEDDSLQDRVVLLNCLLAGLIEEKY